MSNRIILSLRAYPIFALVALAIVVGLILQLIGLQQIAYWLLIVVSTIAAAQIVFGMIATVREGGLGLDILALTAIIVGLLLHEYWAAVVIALMLTGGEALEDYAQRRATNELTALLQRAPKQAHLLQGDGTKDVPIETVQIGDRLRIKPGEVIPVDGKLLTGTTSVDESSLTGESLPITKQAGDELLSGAVNLDAAITIEALRTSQDSQYEQIIQLVKEATNSKAPFVRLADRYSLSFSAVSFAIAFGAWALSGEVVRFLEVIVVATPCPLLIGAPVAIISGMSRAASHGIIIKNGASLERLAAIKSMAFDKTGTLTRGKPVLQQVITYGELEKDKLLALAAAIETNSAHILATAVTTAAKQQKLSLPRINSVAEEPGFGLRADWQNQSVLVGTYAFLHNQQAHFPNEQQAVDGEHTTTFIAIDGQVMGALTFTDEIRPEAAQTIQDLQRGGIAHILMLSGDNASVAKSIAQKVGITEVYAGLLPAQKVQVLKTIGKSYHPSGMVGDGVNDAPVLAASDVGVALGARGSTAASQSADVVIMLDNLHKVAQAVSIAKNTIRIGLQSIWVGIGISVGLMLVFATGKFPAVLGAGLQEIVDVVVIINALRAHGGLSRLPKSRAH
jgi:heavy metal translocating P-type ATPase